jgi:hypothetical protein
MEERANWKGRIQDFKTEGLHVIIHFPQANIKTIIQINSAIFGMCHHAQSLITILNGYFILEYFGIMEKFR